MSIDSKIAHLGFIQAIITRMGSNSFLLKGWSVTLVSAIFTLSAKDPQQSFIYLALFPAIIFWLLDSYFLRQEKLFRKLYLRVADNSTGSEKFTLDTAIVNESVENLICIAISKTILVFHGAIIGTIIIYTLFFLK